MSARRLTKPRPSDRAMNNIILNGPIFTEERFRLEPAGNNFSLGRGSNIRSIIIHT